MNEQPVAPLHPLWAGISIHDHGEGDAADIGIAIYDGNFSLQDFSIKPVNFRKYSQGDEISNHVVMELKLYARRYLAKFIGAGFPLELKEKSPKLSSELWLELDIVPISIMANAPHNDGTKSKHDKHRSWWHKKGLDEQASSMSPLSCSIRNFGPKIVPILQVGQRGLVNFESGFQANIATINDYQRTCSPQTWETMKTYAHSLKRKGVKIAFFSSAYQDDEVALMRQSLVRLAHLLGINLKWYVPKPRPSVIRIARKMHNILQGVCKPDEKSSVQENQALRKWVEENATRYWLSRGGPLRRPLEGGADVVIIDDPQLSRLISLSKDTTPEWPVIFRSHLYLESDLVNQQGTLQANIWEFFYDNIKRADTFISYPIQFLPKDIPKAKVAYMPASTDRLDALNKDIHQWDRSYYRDLYNRECVLSTMPQLTTKKYIIQITRFNVAEDIDSTIKSYGEFYRLLKEHDTEIEVPVGIKSYVL